MKKEPEEQSKLSERSPTVPLTILSHINDRTQPPPIRDVNNGVLIDKSKTSTAVDWSAWFGSGSFYGVLSQPRSKRLQTKPPKIPDSKCDNGYKNRKITPFGPIIPGICDNDKTPYPPHDSVNHHGQCIY